MTYRQPPYDAVSPTPARDRRRIAVAAAIGVVLAGASGVCVVHLAERYEAAAPLRARRAAEAEQRRAAREAQQAAQLKAATPVPVPTLEDRVPVVDVPTLPGVAAGGRAPSGTDRRTAASYAFEWEREPKWPDLDSDAVPHPGRWSVTWSCRANAAGRLSGCSGAESPAGSGLAARTRPALADAVAGPAGPDGNRAGQLTFGVTYTVLERARPAPSRASVETPGEIPTPAPRPDDRPDDGPFGSRSRDTGSEKILPPLNFDNPPPANR